MKHKLLTLRQQMGIFNTQNPVEVMREYVSFSKDVLPVAYQRLKVKDEDFDVSFRRYAMKKSVTEAQKQFFKNLSRVDAREICEKIHGHIYSKVLLKMLDTFPKDVSKELLIEYGKHCFLHDEVLIKAMNVLGKDALEILLTTNYLRIGVFNKILRVFSKAGAKDILISWSDENLHLDREVELKILRIYSNEDIKELLKVFITKSVCIGERLFLKIFEVCSLEEARELIEKAIENDIDVRYEVLKKITECFPPDDAKSLLDTFFEETVHGCDKYDEYEKERLYALIGEEEMALWLQKQC